MTNRRRKDDRERVVAVGVEGRADELRFMEVSTNQFVICNFNKTVIAKSFKDCCVLWSLFTASLRVMAAEAMYGADKL